MRPKKIVIREPIEVFNIVARVNNIGLEATAAQLDCNKSTLSRWLDTQGYVMVRTWENAQALEMKKKVQRA